jgi:Domain of Unknown Function with PDB structure (DUF3857)
VRLHLIFSRLMQALACSCLFVVAIFSFCQTQQPPQKPADKKPEKAAQPEKSENPYQIELLETRYRFEANGDSRKEVHTRVHINNELGVRPFARLNFDYNRSFESIEISLVHITHSSGGTVDILPSAITDNPNPAVVNAPAYQDVRVKSVRILGLEPGDLLEYRIITATTHHPLAPDFWLSHDFAREGIVSQESFAIDLPASRDLRPFTSLAAHDYETIPSGEGSEARLIYLWKRPSTASASPGTSRKIFDLPLASVESDIVLTTFKGWADFEIALQKSYEKELQVTPQLKAKALELTRGSGVPEDDLRALYDFVSKSMPTVDLPLDSAGFQPRGAEQISTSGYGTPEEKCVLLSALATAVGLRAQPAFSLSRAHPQIAPPIPSILGRPLVMAAFAGHVVWLDPSVGVAPFGVIASNMRGGLAVPLYPSSDISFLEDVPKDLPFPASQYVKVDAILTTDGKLTAKVHYSLRGDNELFLRVAFHKSPKDKWKELAQLLSISDGFRGQVTSVTASDPYATKEPFTVEYEITQPKLVDWSKKPVRIPALLPQLGLPDPPAKPAPGAAASPVELGTPLEVETHMTLHLPPGTAAAPPTGTSVQRDYAIFASQYSVKGPVVTASRHINFLLRQVPADRTADYNAFLHAVQSDQAQFFTLDRESPPEPATKPASSTATSPPASKSP